MTDKPGLVLRTQGFQDSSLSIVFGVRVSGKDDMATVSIYVWPLELIWTRIRRLTRPR